MLQGSWNWPFGVKDMDIYGQTGYVKTNAKTIEVGRSEEKPAETYIPKPFKRLVTIPPIPGSRRLR
jgi:hypothetical protein